MYILFSKVIIRVDSLGWIMISPVETVFIDVPYRFVVVILNENDPPLVNIIVRGTIVLLIYFIKEKLSVRTIELSVILIIVTLNWKVLLSPGERVRTSRVTWPGDDVVDISSGIDGIPRGVNGNWGND